MKTQMLLLAILLFLAPLPLNAQGDETPDPASGVVAPPETVSFPPETVSPVFTPTATPAPTVVRAWPVHCYIYIQAPPDMTESQLTDYWRSVSGIGQQIGQVTTQIRLRPDNQAAIVESVFAPAELDHTALVVRLAADTGIDMESLVPTQLYLFDCWSGFEGSRQAVWHYMAIYWQEWNAGL